MSQGFVKKLISGKIENFKKSEAERLKKNREEFKQWTIEIKERISDSTTIPPTRDDYSIEIAKFAKHGWPERGYHGDDNFMLKNFSDFYKWFAKNEGIHLYKSSVLEDVLVELDGCGKYGRESRKKNFPPKKFIDLLKMCFGYNYTTSLSVTVIHANFEHPKGIAKIDHVEREFLDCDF